LEIAVEAADLFWSASNTEVKLYGRRAEASHEDSFALITKRETRIRDTILLAVDSE